MLSTGQEEVRGDEDEHHITQIHEIVPKQTLSRAVGGMLSGKKSRSRSGSVLSTTSVVIGVTVLEATVESHQESEGTDEENVNRVEVVVSSTGPELKTRRSRLSLFQNTRLLAQARSLRDKFRPSS